MLFNLILGTAGGIAAFKTGKSTYEFTHNNFDALIKNSMLTAKTVAKGYLKDLYNYTTSIAGRVVNGTCDILKSESSIGEKLVDAGLNSIYALSKDLCYYLPIKTFETFVKSVESTQKYLNECEKAAEQTVKGLVGYYVPEDEELSKLREGDVFEGACDTFKDTTATIIGDNLV